MKPPEDDVGHLYQDRLDLEWAVLNAVRETMHIALKGRENVTYQQALSLGKELLSALFSSEKSLISKGQEPPLVREFREEAELESSIGKKHVKPAELIGREIKRTERLLEIPGEHKEIRRRLYRLLRAREFFREKGYSEHQLIRRDVFQVARPNLPRSDLIGDNFTEYELPYGRTLRLRMLHPDAPEHSTGADVVYEQCDESQSIARFAFLQYKVWDGERFYFSEALNFPSQLARLNAVVCDRGYCVCSPTDKRSQLYRLPCCAAFLRLTDRSQSADARLVSTGYHVPICVVRDTPERTKNGEKMLTRRRIHGSYVTTKVFEEMFNNVMLGSRWLKYGEVEEFYREHRILDSSERIVVYAQEYSESDIDTNEP